MLRVGLECEFYTQARLRSSLLVLSRDWDVKWSSLAQVVRREMRNPRGGADSMDSDLLVSPALGVEKMEQDPWISFLVLINGI